MGQEFIIKSQNLEDKINQLLPSQGGAQAGVDLSASTQIIPIVDLTETAEGSSLRQDLQKALSHGSCTSFFVANTTTTIINNTGYYRIYGIVNQTPTSPVQFARFQLSDGFSTKDIWYLQPNSTTTTNYVVQYYDFIVYLEAGDSLIAQTTGTSTLLSGTTRQIATISGELVNP